MSHFSELKVSGRRPVTSDVSPMRILATTALIIVAVAGCGRESDATNSEVETPGSGEIVIMDPSGGSASCEINVSRPPPGYRRCSSTKD